MPVKTVVLVPDPADQIEVKTAAKWSPLWLLRDSNPDEATLRKVLTGLTFPPGDGYVWIAGEMGMVSRLRDYIVEERRHPADWVRASGYWKRDPANRVA